VFGGNSKKEWFVRSRLAIKTHAFLERWFPERRVFLRSEVDTRFIRLRPHVQLIGFTGAALVMAWSIIATSILLMDSIGAGNFREQAKRDQRMYEERLNFLSSERDARAAEALAAQQRFNSALEQISVMQSQLLASETRRRELETGIEVIQSTLRRTMKERDTLGAELAQLQAEDDSQNSTTTGLAALPVAEDTLGLIVEALASTAAERDQIRSNAQTALVDAETMAQKIITMQEQNEAIFRQLEEAMAISVAPLDRMFRKAGMNTDSLIEQVKRGYSGQGGPLTPIALSTRGELPSEATERANRLLDQMDRLNLYRIAAQAAPFAIPVKSSYRFTSGYGYRRDPKTGGRRMHSGVDFAGPVGTPLYATADGVVTHAGWLSGYGRLVKIKHEFGIETRYAHMSKIRVKVGQRVSRGERIGDMGASGRVTGPHLHYEVRVGGKAVNPMIYIKAANDVF
jgi:murein DD-endopeptidase MepM/ murein hydrolase activator NlpD